ncbi:MAG: SDR family NAD(P)-dependent oxidoreductase [Gemmatimonadaceae bacterium]
MPNVSAERVALVTGARTGVGRHLAQHLLARGYAVVGCSRSPQDWAADGYRHFQADVTDEEQVKGLFRAIAQDFGRLDVAINNAGVASMNHVLLTPVSSLRKMLETHVCGTFVVSREAVLLMRQRKYGRIVNFSSVAVPLRYPGQAAYVASKAAVEALSQVMAREVAEFGITVNVLAPGPTQTDMIRGVPKAKLQRMVALFPSKALTTFEDIAGAIELFLRPDNGAITGQVVYLGGVPNN